MKTSFGEYQETRSAPEDAALSCSKKQPVPFLSESEGLLIDIAGGMTYGNTGDNVCQQRKWQSASRSQLLNSSIVLSTTMCFQVEVERSRKRSRKSSPA